VRRRWFEFLTGTHRDADGVAGHGGERIECNLDVDLHEHDVVRRLGWLERCSRRQW
jgi:hypothetical protein